MMIRRAGTIRCFRAHGARVCGHAAAADTVAATAIRVKVAGGVGHVGESVTGSERALAAVQVVVPVIVARSGEADLVGRELILQGHELPCVRRCARPPPALVGG